MNYTCSASLPALRIVTKSILPKAIYRFIAILIKIRVTTFAEIEKIHSKIRMESQGTPNSQCYLKKNAGGLTLPDFKIFLLWCYSNQNSVVLVWNNEYRSTPYISGQIILDMEVKTILFKNSAEKTGYPYAKE